MVAALIQLGVLGAKQSQTQKAADALGRRAKDYRRSADQAPITGQAAQALRANVNEHADRMQSNSEKLGDIAGIFGKAQSAASTAKATTPRPEEFEQALTQWQQAVARGDKAGAARWKAKYQELEARATAAQSAYNGDMSQLLSSIGQAMQGIMQNSGSGSSGSGAGSTTTGDTSPADTSSGTGNLADLGQKLWNQTDPKWLDQLRDSHGPLTPNEPSPTLRGLDNGGSAHGFGGGGGIGVVGAALGASVPGGPRMPGNWNPGKPLAMPMAPVPGAGTGRGMGSGMMPPPMARGDRRARTRPGIQAPSSQHEVPEIPAALGIGTVDPRGTDDASRDDVQDGFREVKT